MFLKSMAEMPQIIESEGECGIRNRIGGYSQEELAGRAKLHRTYVGSVERGERNVSLVNLDRLAKALGVNVGDFFRTR